MSDFPDLVAPYQRVPLVHDTTDLFDPETMTALDARYTLAGALPARATVAYTTTVQLATNAQETGVVALGKQYDLIRVNLSHAARVRLYDSTGHQSADLSRPRGTDPTGDHGVMLDFALNPPAQYTLSPVVSGMTFNGSTNVPITIDNLGAFGFVTVTFTFLRTE